MHRFGSTGYRTCLAWPYPNSHEIKFPTRFPVETTRASRSLARTACRQINKVPFAVWRAVWIRETDAMAVDVDAMSVSQLRAYLREAGADTSSCFEKVRPDPIGAGPTGEGRIPPSFPESPAPPRRSPPSRPSEPPEAIAAKRLTVRPDTHRAHRRTIWFDWRRRCSARARPAPARGPRAPGLRGRRPAPARPPPARVARGPSPRAGPTRPPRSNASSSRASIAPRTTTTYSSATSPRPRRT